MSPRARFVLLAAASLGLATPIVYGQSAAETDVTKPAGAPTHQAPTNDASLRAAEQRIAELEKLIREQEARLRELEAERAAPQAPAELSPPPIDASNREPAVDDALVDPAKSPVAMLLEMERSFVERFGSGISD